MKKIALFLCAVVSLTSSVNAMRSSQLGINRERRSDTKYVITTEPPMEKPAVLIQYPSRRKIVWEGEEGDLAEFKIRQLNSDIDNINVKRINYYSSEEEVSDFLICFYKMGKRTVIVEIFPENCTSTKEQ